MIKPPECTNSLCIKDQDLLKKYETEGHSDGLKMISEKETSKYWKAKYKCLFCNEIFYYSIPRNDGVVY